MIFTAGYDLTRHYVNRCATAYHDIMLHNVTDNTLMIYWVFTHNGGKTFAVLLIKVRTKAAFTY